MSEECTGDKLRRDHLRFLLSMVTERQLEIFNKMYISVDKIESAKMNWAILQCERTLKENECAQPKT